MDNSVDQSPPCPPGNLVCAPLKGFPKTLAETGLLGLVLPSPAHARPAAARGYVPVPELYSDGLTKGRFMLLPPGTRVNNQNRAAWEFPVGVIFVKTFFDQRAGSERPVETRLIRRGTDRFEPFEYAVYRWSDDGREATLLDISGNNHTAVMVSVAGRSFAHTIPSQNDCAECHEKNARAASTIIGFDEIRLNHTAQASGGETLLEAFAKAGVFSAPIPTMPAKIVDANPTLQRVKTFVFGNCVHCHHGQQGVVDFRPDVLVANTVGKLPESPGVTAPDGWARVVPGVPEKSVLYVQARGTGLPNSLKPMPQIGVEVRDLPAFVDELDAMKAWITSLPAR